VGENLIGTTFKSGFAGSFAGTVVGTAYSLASPDIAKGEYDVFIKSYNLKQLANDNVDNMIDAQWAHDHPGEAYRLLIKRRFPCK
jgi:hypothetical protein